MIEGGRPARAPGVKRPPTRQARKKRRLVLAFLALAAAGLVTFLLLGPVMRNIESRRVLSGTQAEMEREKAETAELEERRERAKTEEFIESEARDMGYVKEGEIPIVIIDEQKDQQPAAETANP